MAEPWIALRRIPKMRATWLASVAIVGMTASFALWNPLAAYERAHVSRLTLETMQSLRADLRSDMQSHLLAQIELAELWGDRSSFSDQEQELSSRLFLDHHTGYLTLAWIDEGRHLLRAFDRKGPMAAAALEEDMAQALSIMSRPGPTPPERDPVVTPRFELPDGRTAFRVIVPVVRRDSVVGYVAAVVDARAAFDAMVDDHKDLGYSVSVAEGPAEIYRMPGSQVENEDTLEKECTLQLPGTAWTVCVWPKPELLTFVRSSLPKVAMVLGGLLGSVLMLAIHFGRSAQRTSKELQCAHDELEQRVKERTLDLERANNSLQSEVGDRKRAEESYRQLSGRLLQLQDEERRRIARDLHDSTAQMLGALAINVDRARVLSQAPDRAPLDRVLGESGRFVEEITQEIRTVSYLLHPPMLDDLGLEYVLPWYVDGFGRRSGLDVSLDVQPDIGRLPREIELTLFRIAQEALANVYRHSGSPSVAISLSRDAESVILEVSDRGVGLPQSTLDAFVRAVGTAAPMGVGIAGMRERVHQLRGQMGIASDAEGTTIRTVLPLIERAVTVKDTCCGPACGCPVCGGARSPAVCEAQA